MLNRLYWITATLLLAIAVHLAVVVFTPRAAMSRMMHAVKPLGGENALKLLPPADAARLLGETAPDQRVAACVFDLKRGPVTITAIIPPRDWKMDIYASDGTSIYALNDRQARPGPMQVVLKLTERGSLLTPSAMPESAPEPNRFIVETARETGLAVIRARLTDPAYAARLADEFARASCTEGITALP